MHADLQQTYFLPYYLLYPLAGILSCIISVYAVRKIIFITDHRKIYDIPDDIRKFHGAQIPSLGGIGIFIGYLVVACFFMYLEPKGWSYILASSIILFFTGVYDDLMNMRPSKKLVAQLFASFITVCFTGIRITSFEGILGLGEIPTLISVGLTTLMCTFFINVFNFIDGIDGLACATAIFYTFALGVCFVYLSHPGLAGISFSIAGATTGLLFFNKAPARIYMGDTGSMLLGFSIFILSVLAINSFAESKSVSATPVIFQYFQDTKEFIITILSLLYLPVFDALRVFAIRIYKKTSPLKADRTHLHYYLLDAGFNHTQSVLILLGINILIVALGYVMRNANSLLTIGCVTLLLQVIVGMVYLQRKKCLNASTINTQRVGTKILSEVNH